jgi:predicted transcriptional regulator
MAKVSLTAGVDAKLAAKVVEQAEQAGLPLSVVVERALAQYLERPQEPKRQKPRSGRVTTVHPDDQSQS